MVAPFTFGVITVKKFWMALAALVIGGMLIACGAGSSSDEPINLDGSSASGAAGGIGDASPAPVKTKAGTIGNGTWRVGKDIKAGEYRSTGMAPDGVVCNWSVKKSAENYADSGLTDKVADPQLTTIKVGQTFETSGCAVWVRQ